jgi:hypothetical protein
MPHPNFAVAQFFAIIAKNIAGIGGTAGRLMGKPQ